MHECTSGGQNKMSSVLLLDTCSVKVGSFPQPGAHIFLARLEGRKPQQSVILLSLHLEAGLLVQGTSFFCRFWGSNSALIFMIT